MKSVIAVLCLMLSGCAIFSAPVPRHNQVSVTVELVDSLPNNYTGMAVWNGPSCHVRLLRSAYPRCLQHEIRHCFEGPFHGNHASSEDCFN